MDRFVIRYIVSCCVIVCEKVHIDENIQSMRKRLPDTWIIFKFYIESEYKKKFTDKLTDVNIKDIM